MAHAVHGHITNVPASHLAMVSHPGGVTAVIRRRERDQWTASAVM